MNHGGEEKRNKSNKISRYAIMVSILMILLVGFIFKEHIIYGISPRISVLSAINRTRKAMDRDMKNIESLLVANVDKYKDSSREVNLFIDEISHEDPLASWGLSNLRGMAIDLLSTDKREKKEIKFEGKISHRERKLISLEGELNDEEILIYLPQVYPKLFSLPSKELGRKWKESSLSRISKISPDESLDLSYSRLKGPANKEEINREIDKAYEEAIKAMLVKGNFLKEGRSKIPMDEGEKSAYKTSLIIDKKDVKEGIIQIIEAMKVDNRIKSWRGPMMIGKKDPGPDEFEKKLDNIMERINNNNFQDLLIEVYTYKGQLVQVDYGFSPSPSHKTKDIKLSLSLLGKKSPLDKMDLQVYLGEKEEKKILFNLEGKHRKRKGFSNKAKLMIMEDEKEIVNLLSAANVDLLKKEDNLSYNLNILSEEVSIKLDINGQLTQSPRKTDYQLWSIRIETTDQYKDKFQFGGSLGLTLEEGERDMASLNHMEKLAILDMKFADILHILQGLARNLINVRETLGIN